jgi:hypothetical protein
MYGIIMLDHYRLTVLQSEGDLPRTSAFKIDESYYLTGPRMIDETILE